MAATDNKKEAILKAASEIITREGYDKLTLEMTAKRAGVSKGGLLYHFPSKEALIQGLLSQLLDLFDAPGPEDGDLLKKFVDSIEAPGFDPTFFSVLISAVSADPRLMEPVAARYREWQQELERRHDPVFATIIRLASDGLLFADMLNLAPPSPEVRRRLLEYLRAYVRDNPPR